jgi:glutamine synthetase
MTESRKVANNMEDLVQKAKMYTEEVKGYFEEIRYHVDKLELIIDDEDWPLVKYREMLFIR